MSEINLDELRRKYPKHTIRSQPAAGCRCKGAGEYLSKAGKWMPCLCVCLGGDDETRAMCATALHVTVPAKMREEAGR